MKKLFCTMPALLLCASAFAQGIDLEAMSTDELKVLVSEAESIISSRRTGFPTLDEYIERHNAAMPFVSLESETHICRAHIPVEAGEINDTFMFSVSGDSHGFIMLRIEKQTENIIDAFAYVTQPKLLLDYVASLAHGTGFLKDKDNMGNIFYLNGPDVLMGKLGLYESSTFEPGKTSSVTNESGTMKFSCSFSEELNAVVLTVSKTQ